jgi:multiple sugar transport system substrate-binding protein
VGGIAAALLMLLAACGGTAPREDKAASDAPAKGEIRFLVFGDPAELAAFRDVVGAFQRSQPDVTVQLVEASDRADLIARVSTSIAGGSPPDVFLMNYRYYGQFAAKRAIEPIDERLRGSKAVREDDFYPEALDAFRWGGRLQCLPQNISSLAVYYNRDLFRKYGVQPPRAGWTWNEMIATAAQLTRDAGGRVVRASDPDAGGTAAAVYGLGVEPTLIRVAPFVWSNGGQLVDDERRPTRLALDSPQAKPALRAFLELRSPYGVVPTDDEVEAEDDEARFANGRLAMVLSSRRATPTFRKSAKFDWDVAPLPVHAQPAGILHSDAYCIPTGSKNKAAAWRFVEYALGEEGQTIVARTGRTVPSMKRVSRSPAFLDSGQRPRSAQVFLDAIPTVRRSPLISTWPEIEDATEGILENGLYHGEPVDQVVAKLDAATRQLFARGQVP